jgi:hypothetical protein
MFVAKFEGLLSNPETKTCVRIRLFQLIATFIELDDEVSDRRSREPSTHGRLQETKGTRTRED